uniref:Small ribosomal subunit protein uS19c n=1 Tax=Chlorodesmis fastigiata TaxID=189431 RepID=A0A2P0QHG8_CHLFS|nr:ribosomal protein S19 [Chlorodesmis fastigiata]ARO74217.1 ribosomal protein S19 [Chlorodesmis fastigiata]
MRLRKSKSFFIAINLILKFNSSSKKQQIFISTWSRSSTVIPIMIGHTLAIHNGQKHVPVYITEQMISHKLGEFSPTRFFKGHKKTDKKSKRR